MNQPAPLLHAEPGRCEEASPLSRDRYIPCNAPGSFVVYGDHRHFVMCAPCATHNVKRGMQILGSIRWGEQS